MFPVLFHIGPLPVYTYGFLVAAGILVSAFLMRRHAQKEGLQGEEVLDLVLYFTLSSFVGARIFYTFQHLDYYLGRPLEIFAIWEGGVVFYGGAIGGLLFLLGYAARKRWPYLKITDFLAPYVFLTHAFGRVGCFFNGCCYGKTARFPWAVRYPFLSDPVHPSQIYSAAFNLSAFVFLLYVHRRKNFDGETTLAYFLIYGSGRFLLETFRGDNAPFLWGFTLPQTLSVIFILLASLTYFVCCWHRIHGENRIPN